MRPPAPGEPGARGPASEARRPEGCGPSCSQVLLSRVLPPRPPRSGTCPRPGAAAGDAQRPAISVLVFLLYYPPTLSFFF